MQRYIYKAKNNQGDTVTGEVESTSIEQAAKLIRRRGLIVITLKPKSEFSLNPFKKLTERVGVGEVTTITRQLSTMMNAGLPLTEALLILRSQSKESLSKIISQILADVEAGEALSAAMSKYPHIFSKTYLALIKSGEVGGVLDEVLLRLAEDMEKQQEFRAKVKGAMIYPTIIVLGMIAVALIMVIFVLPRLTTLYEEFQVELPLLTRILISVSKFMLKYWPVVILSLGGLVWLFNLYRHTQKGKRKYDEIVLKIPLIGDLKRQIILTELTRTLALMIGSGVSILESLTIASEVVGSTVISEALNDATKMIEKGFPIAFAFSRHPEAFPFILSQMIAVGEETGKMDEVLLKISHVFETESDQKLKALTAAIEPMILIVLGVGVALMVIAIILPIYNLTTQFGT